jgi:hypothetical protein
MSSAIRAVSKAATERIMDIGPGRARAFLAATITGAATAVVTYKALRDDLLGGE